MSSGGQAHSATHGCGQVGDDVTEQVVGNDHVEAPRIGDHEDGGGVDVLVSDLDVGVVLPYLGHDSRPELAGERQHVGLVHQRQVLATALGALECVGHNAAHTEGGVQ